MADFPDFPDHIHAVLAIDLEDGWEPDIGRLVWMLDAARRRTLRELEDIAAVHEQAILDWKPGPQANSVGTILYHLALIEEDYLYCEVLQKPLPAVLEALFPYDVREEDGVLSPVTGQTLATHLQRLEICHDQLRSAYHIMTLDDFRRLRHLESYSATPEWVLHHLIQHEAEHRSQLFAALRAAEQALGLKQ
jgi:uncharacterized damage-inducible protein DinB